MTSNIIKYPEPPIWINYVGYHLDPVIAAFKLCIYPAVNGNKKGQVYWNG